MLRGLEQELEVDLIPGTEIMIDFGKPHFVKATGSDCVLVHQPSSSPHDPLVRHSCSRCRDIAAKSLAELVTKIEILCHRQCSSLIIRARLWSTVTAPKFGSYI
jgi:hypothetical protein